MTKRKRHAGGSRRGGKKPKLCGANKTSGDGTCAQPAGWGTEHTGRGRCKWHGGCTPSHVNKAKREELQEAVETYGLPRDIEPQDALLEELHRTAGHIAWLELRIRSKQPDELTWGKIKSVDGVAEEGAKPSVELLAYWQERKHYVVVARTAIALGIEAARLRLVEQYGTMIAQVIHGVAEDYGIADDPELPKRIRRHLTLVDGGKAA